MLTEAQVAQYHEDGYVIPDFRLSDDVLESIRRDHDQLLARNPDFRDYCPALLAHDLGFLEYARNGEILDMVSQVIGPDIILWNMSFFAKPAGNGKETPWHQDGEYWPIRPLATCTVWVAIDNATPKNGCLRIMPGSHKDQRLRPHETNPDPNFTLNQEIDKGEYDEAKAVDLVLEAGQISLHDVYLVHGSAANSSAKSRRGMTLRLMPTTSVFDRDFAAEKSRDLGVIDHGERSIFLLRGVDRSGENDLQVRN